MPGKDEGIMTYTYALIEVSPLVYDDIKNKLLAAGWDHALDEPDVIDLHGLVFKREESSTGAPVVDAHAPEKILAAAAELKEAISDAKAKLLLELEQAVKVGYHMRRAQNAYFAAKTGKQQLLVEAKRLETAFDRRCAELKTMGVDLG